MAKSSIYIPPPKGTKNKPFFASVQVMKTIVGTGVLGLPNIFKNFGLIFAFLFFILIYTLNYYAALLLIKAKNMSKNSNYCSIG